jgi:hypothetical protein
VPRRFDAVICDVDGCLGPESTAPLDAPALAVLAEHNRRAIEAGDRPVITLCSGRPQPFVEALCRLLGNSALPAIAEMGVWVFDPRGNQYLLDPSITPDHLAAVRDAERFVLRDLAPRGVVIQPCKTASMSLWHADTAYLMTLKPMLAQTFAREGWPLRVSSTVAWINCDLAHVNKDTGIVRLLALTGLTRDRLAGVGDTLGDLAIRRSVAYFACPSNADPALAAHADYVSPRPEVEGVIDIVARLGRTSP